MKINKKILVILLLIIFIPAGILTFMIKENHKKEEIAKKEAKQEALKNEKSMNIALFGLDRRSKEEKSRADSIMVANINFETKTINLVSILRDTLVDIKGHGKDKLNHSYAYGGPELSMETINSNFDLDINKYVSVDFFSLAKVIDIIGGVDIDLKDYEANQINQNLNEINSIEKLPKGTDYMQGISLKNLNGRQAVAYCRIRKEGNGDYERTQRQRNVLKAILLKYEKLDSGKRFEVGMEMMSQVNTNIPINDIKELQNKILNDKDFTINQHMIPFEGSFETKIIDKKWVIDANMKENIKKIHEYLK
ncbi:LCP family protein [Paraclostridium sordellii]|uniref:Cell envelope-like transcriptional attenuator domain-containing protein n=1 Tax=Paraclostridium sordellii TaxID=1505 RepID=A0A0C7QJH7_PARSO|nr:LCP family protein [Paeniclostridium sordellii]CEN77613.1 cell envelope-like transcriptional attenuator domain-containing protein [[Clostridium] sordellii] [Paeniclostridium sordellii]CEO06196.1 cell envelope-like transcriptional attenuator domain-containing protein [[Clostridium] sordellii] [Paeniclostridium sordellii]CEP86424.1 cell envelope-like transcriptional attenuator domain-containing protein [[Clostridium] sordellii] [Paeniclostridium sordellii]CEP96675.1 cell envelope-like transcri